MNLARIKEENPILETLRLHHLWLLTKGIKGSRAVFIRGEIKDLNFAKLDVSYAIFRNCAIKNCVFHTSDLKGTNFTGSTLYNVVFSCKVLKDINFEKVIFSGVHFAPSAFVTCRFKQAKLEKTSIKKCKFIKSNIENSVFVYSDFNDSSFKECNLETVAFKACDFTSARFNLSLLNEINFSGDNLYNAHFKNSTVSKVHFKSWKKGEPNIIKSNLELTKFIDCKIEACVFDENKKSVNAKIIKTKSFSYFSKNSITPEKKIAYLAQATNICTFLEIMSFFTSFILFKQISDITRLAYCIFIFIVAVSLGMLNKLYFECVKKYGLSFLKTPFAVTHSLKFRQSGKSSAFTSLLFIYPCLLLMGGWLTSIKSQNFFLSLAHLLIFFYPMVLNFTILNSIIKNQFFSLNK